MANLTIRNIPHDLHNELKERAKGNRRSLNQEVISVLARSSGHTNATKEHRVRQMITTVQEIRRGLTAPLTKEEIRDAIDDGRM